jgi:hypothetical protein
MFELWKKQGFAAWGGELNIVCGVSRVKMQEFATRK